jgi:UDP:flavonoid glycosyltransferase YjiC (YdhE family)
LGKDAGSGSDAGNNAPVWPELSAATYFMTDTKAFEYADVTVDCQVKLDAVAPLIGDVDRTAKQNSEQ